MEVRLPRPKLIALAISAAFSMLPFHAHASPITVTSSYNLGNGALVGGDTQSGSNVDYYLWSDTAGGNSVFFHTYGYDAGGQAVFGARTSAEGVFSATSRVSYSTLVNISGGAQSVGFDFQVDNSEIAFYNAMLGHTANARLQLVISIDGNELTKEDISIDLTADGMSTCTDSGLGMLDSYLECPGGSTTGISRGAQNFSIDLGIKASDFTLQYDIIATVSGDMAAGTDCSYGGAFVEDGYGGGIEFANQVNAPAAFTDGYGGGISCSPGQAIARSGDPNNFSFSDPFRKTLFEPENNTAPFSITQTPANPVPEPSSLALAGVALAALAARKRRKTG